jgi:oligopeptide transport system ATP-binding protein
MRRGVLKAVDGVSFGIEKGETLGIAGETGSGKSVTALSVMRLVQFPGKIVTGKILLEGEDLVQKSESEMRKVRGKKISMIFQDPSAALDPVYSIGDQLREAINVHMELHSSEAKAEASRMLELVGIPTPAARLNDYPHELSGGMKQRVMIAMALSCKPLLLIADEATTNLDVTIQAQVLDLMRELRSGLQTSILLITHDMGVVAEMCDRVAIMYAGELVELGNLDDIFYDCVHPYTRALLQCIPRGKSGKELRTIGGSPPDLICTPSGCKFRPRCTLRLKCSDTKRAWLKVGPDHFASCDMLRH